MDSMCYPMNSNCSDTGSTITDDEYARTKAAVTRALADFYRARRRASEVPTEVYERVNGRLRIRGDQ